MSDVKLVFLIGLMCLGFYWVYGWMSSNDTGSIPGRPRMPSISFKSSAPAAKTSEQPQKERAGARTNAAPSGSTPQ
jgi:hypothetical protein